MWKLLMIKKRGGTYSASFFYHFLNFILSGLVVIVFNQTP